MYQPRVFCVKLQLHFGGDVHEISVPAYGGAEPTVDDLMNVVERDYRVPRALQNLVFHGQELHGYVNEPLSRFGIKNGAAIRLVGRMVPPQLVQPINHQYGTDSYSQVCYPPQVYQQTIYPQQTYEPAYYSQSMYPAASSMGTFHTTEQTRPYYYGSSQNATVGTQYDPPSQVPLSERGGQPLAATPNKGQPVETSSQNGGNLSTTSNTK
jgi:hypothetical protein